MAAELGKTRSLEEMSDQLAETLFGSEELEAISLQIRDETPPEEENPVALEPTDLPSAASPVATPPVAKAAPAPAAAPPAAPKPPPASKPAADVEIRSEPAAAAGPPPANSGSQPEPIENQFNTSMTATLKTLNNHSKAPDGEDEDENEDENENDDEKASEGLLGRLKNTFKS